ncbi:MAG: serine hydrolase [Bacteroidota bacterium]
MNLSSTKNKLIIVIIALILASLYWAFWSNSAYFAQESKTYTAEVDRYTKKVMENNAIPGTAVAIVKQGKIIYSKCFGLGDSEVPAKSISPASNFHLASISKAFVAIAIKKMEEQRRIDLDKPLISYYPRFVMADPRCKIITIRQILNHTSGIPDVENYHWQDPDFDSLATERYIATLATKKLLFDPGTQWDYSNAAYDLLGLLVSYISHKSFERYMKENILQPLGMAQSTFLLPEIDSSQRIRGHTGKFKATPVSYYPYNRAHAPSSTLQSNLHDVTQFVQNIFHGESSSKIPISDASLESLWTPAMKVNEKLESGLGWFVTRHRRNRVVIAAGRDPGFASAIALLPEKQLGIITLTNSSLEPSIQLDFILGILDIGQGKEKNPIASVSLPVGKVYEAKGVDAAIAEYFRIKEEEASRYKVGIGELTWVIHEMIDRERYDDALKLLDVEAKEYPRCHICYTYAQVYQKKGNRELTAQYYKKWLEYLPDERDSAMEKYLNAN